MSDFSIYDIHKDKYKKLLASYLQNDGTQLMNMVRLKYDIINNYKNRIVEFWRLFDIDYLENLYIEWRLKNTNLPDSLWVYTDFLERICKSYQITREYYSYWANETIRPGTDPEVTYETTNILLNNLNMTRLLKIRRSSVGFDGTRENLVAILQNSLNNKYRVDLTSEIGFILQTVTTVDSHATLNVRIVAPTSNSVIWTNYDYYLAKDGQYFVQLLGIVADVDVVDSETLIFDSGKYDEKKYT